MNRYEQTLLEMEEYVDSCKKQKFSDTNIIVDRDELKEYISELNTNTPEEIKKYRKIINNRDEILDNAHNKANAMVEQAKQDIQVLVSEHEIMQRAQEEGQALVDDASAQAQQILDNAVSDANDIREGVMQYTDDTLLDLQNIIENTIENVTAKYDAFMKALNTSLEVVIANRKELAPKQDVVSEKDSLDDLDLNDNTDDFDIGGDIEDYTANTDFLNEK